MLVDNGLAQRVLTNPGVLLFAGLTIVALVAERSLLGPGTLGGGALIPASGGAAGSVARSTCRASTRPGSARRPAAPPYLAVIAALATVLGGKPWLAVDVILLGCVPLAGLTAYLAARRITRFGAGPGLGRRDVRAAAGGDGRGRRRPDSAPRSSSCCCR